MMRKVFIAVATLILITAVSIGLTSRAQVEAMPAAKLALENVRYYAAALTQDGASYAVDGGVLMASTIDGWTPVETPSQVIVSSVAIDSQHPQTLYIGAANELAIYRSTDAGRTWLAVPLTSDVAGGVTDLAVDSAQRLVYVGTDTAGLFRLRDVGSSMTLSGQLLLNEPVLQVAADSTGAGLAFVRTAWRLYRAENFGLSWIQVQDLRSTPTALAVANTEPATVYVGTVDRGLLASHDGLSWTPVNQGLGMAPGARLQIDDVAVDPAQPTVLYVASSYLYGSTQVHATPSSVAMSTDGAQAWTPLAADANLRIAELMPVSGVTGAAYALTTESRAPLAVGSAPALAAADVTTAAAASADRAGSSNGVLAWVVAALAAVALAFAVASDLRSRQPATGTAAPSYAAVRR